MQKERTTKFSAIPFPIRSYLYFLTILLVCRSLYIIVVYYHNTTIPGQSQRSSSVRSNDGKRKDVMQMEGGGWGTWERFSYNKVKLELLKLLNINYLNINWKLGRERIEKQQK